MVRFILFTLLFPVWLAAGVEYTVRFQGIINKETLEILSLNSNLQLLEKNPPSSLLALKRRAEADIPNLIHALHSLGFYNARVDFVIEEDLSPVAVLVHIDPGPVYPLLGYEIAPSSSFDSDIFAWIDLRYLGIELGCPAYTKTILDSEAKLLELLALKGYPLASIERRRVVADQNEKGIYVQLTVNPGLQVVFGHTTVCGLEEVHPDVVSSRIAWIPGQPYNPAMVNQTEYALERLGLFSSINIFENEEELEENRLPITIYLKEACHRTLGLGLSYNTQLGVGGTFHWEHRNVRGMGERFKVKTDLWQRKQTGVLLYVIPDFLERYQELRLVFEIDKEITKGYDEFYYSGSALLDKQISPNLCLSYGGTYKQLFSSHSDNNRPSHLLKTPFYFRYTDMNHPICPTDGYTVTFRTIPTLNIYPQFAYAINTATLTGYYSVFGDDFLVLAGKGHWGSIFGSKRITIPPPERFYAGSQCLLRGYKYMTVSPLGPHDKPLGGRSMMVYSLEARFKINQCGWAFFYEVGNVYSQIVPQLFTRQLQSVGIGLHYYTQMGPLRLDIAFPLQPRKHIDKPFQFYLSLGQSF